MHVCRYVYIYMYHYAHRTFYLCCSFTLLMYLVLCCVLCSIQSAGTLDVCIRLGHFMSARSKGRSPIIIIIIRVVSVSEDAGLCGCLRRRTATSFRKLQVHAPRAAEGVWLIATLTSLTQKCGHHVTASCS